MKFIEQTFFVDPRPLQLTCDDKVNKALGSVVDSMSRFFLGSKSAISRGGLSVKNDAALSGECSNLDQAASKLIPLATERLFSSDLLKQKHGDEWMNLVSNENFFLRGIALFVLKSALPNNHQLVREITGLKKPDCGQKCTVYFYLFASTAFQLIIDRRHRLAAESYGILTVVQRLLRFGSNPSGFLEMRNDVQSKGFFDWTVNVRDGRWNFVEGFRTAIVSLYAISKICGTPDSNNNVFQSFPSLVVKYLSPEQMEAAKSFVENFHNLRFDSRTDGYKIGTCHAPSRVAMSLYASLSSHLKNPNDIQNMEIPYITKTLQTGDFSDILAVDNSDAWTRLVTEKKLESEWRALSQLLREKIGASAVLKSPFSRETRDSTIKRVYGFVCFIAAFYVLKKFEDISVVAQVVHFANNFPAKFCVGHTGCLKWTALREGVHIPGLTVWTAILLALGTSTNPEYTLAIRSQGVKFVVNMIRILSTDPDKAKKLVCMLEKTPLADLRMRIATVNSLLLRGSSPLDTIPSRQLN